MPNVFPNAMVAHVWAQLTQPEGRSQNGNFLFSGPFLYSYGPHYVVAYATPGGLYLLNADSSSMTTTGKHKPAAWRAVDYGRGKFANTHSIPGLTVTAEKLHRALYEYHWSKASESEGKGRPAFLPLGWVPRPARETLGEIPAMAKHLESAGGAYWPGTDAAAAIFRAMGEADAKAARRAAAGARRVAKASEARRKLAEGARMAKTLCQRTPEQAAGDVRHHLVKAAESGSRWGQERAEEDAREEAREYHRAAKAAKAKGWEARARKLWANYRAARAELARYEAAQSRYADRARVRSFIRIIRTAPEQTRQFWALNPGAAPGADVAPAQLDSAVRACRVGQKGFAELSEALGELGRSRYAGAVWGDATFAACDAAEFEAHATSEALAGRAQALHVELTREAAAVWRAGGRAGYGVPRLEDAEGGALLRAEDVTRDESGTITGGLLVTSWGAQVPLTHALKAFRFLKLCRTMGERDSSFDGWRANGRTIRVGHFRVDSVDARGNFRAGCHFITWAECERLARALDVAELAPSDEALTPSGAAA